MYVHSFISLTQKYHHNHRQWLKLSHKVKTSVHNFTGFIKLGYTCSSFFSSIISAGPTRQQPPVGKTVSIRLKNNHMHLMLFTALNKYLPIHIAPLSFQSRLSFAKDDHFSCCHLQVTEYPPQIFLGISKHLNEYVSFHIIFSINLLTIFQMWNGLYYHC